MPIEVFPINPLFETDRPFIDWPLQWGQKCILNLEDGSVIKGDFAGKVDVQPGAVSYFFNNILITAQKDFVPDTVFVQNHNYIFNNINDVRIPTEVKQQGKPIVITVYYPSGGAPIFEFSVLSAIPRTTEGVQLDALSAQSSSKRRATRDMASRGMNAPLDRLGRPKLPKEIKALINKYVGNDTSLQTLAGPPSSMDTVRLVPNGVGGKRFRKRRTQKAKKQNNTYKSRV